MILLFLNNLFAMQGRYHLAVQDKQSGLSIKDKLCKEHFRMSFPSFLALTDEEKKEKLKREIDHLEDSTDSYILRQDTSINRAEHYIIPDNNIDESEKRSFLGKFKKRNKRDSMHIESCRYFIKHFLEDEEVKQYCDNNDIRNSVKKLEEALSMLEDMLLPEKIKDRQIIISQAGGERSFSSLSEIENMLFPEKIKDRQIIIAKSDSDEEQSFSYFPEDIR